MELVLEILLLLDVYELLQCRLVCKEYDQLIHGEKRLQYSIELARAGCVDCPSDRLPVPQRLLTLQTSQAAWRDLNFGTKKSFKDDAFPNKYVLWRFRGSVLVLAYLDGEHDFEDGEYSYFNMLDVLFVRCTDQEQAHRTHRLGKVFTGLAIDPAQDLLVLWEAHHFDTKEEGLPMTCLSLCHGTPHEQTSLHSVTIPLPDEFDEGAVHILGDWITVSSINTKQATIEWKSDTVNSVSDQRGCMISANCFLVPRLRETGTLSLDAYAYVKTKKSGSEFRLAAIFELPCPRETRGVKTTCQAFASGCFQPKPSPLFPPRPYISAPDPLMVLLEIAFEDYWQTYEVFVRTQPIIAVIRAWKPARARKQNFVTVAWDDWGPNCTYWFHNHRFGNTIYSHEPHSWRHSFYGYRALTPAGLLDFNPADLPPDVHKDNARRRRFSIAETHYGTIAEDSEAYFQHAVATNAPYCRREVPEESWLAMTCRYWMLDEEVLTVLDRNGNEWQPHRRETLYIDNLAVLVPGPETPRNVAHCWD